MTIPDWVLLNVAMAEAVALALAWLVILAHGLHTVLARRREPRIARARDIVVRALLTRSLPRADRETLQRLRRRELVTLFERVAPNLRGRERVWLGELARSLGLVVYGKRLSRSPWWWRRLEGARLLTLAGGVGNAVLDLADDSNELVRSQVAEWCGSNPSDRALSTLIDMLGDPSHASRFAVQDALVRVGGAAVEPLLKALERIPISPGAAGPGQDEHAALAGLAVARGIGDGRLADAVVRLTDHPQPPVRTAAFRALASCGGEGATERLMEGLGDPDDGPRAAAAAALGELGYWQAGPRLARSLGDTSWDVRVAAGRSLIRLGPPGRLLLRQATRSENDFVADMALHAMDTARVVTRFGGA